MEREPRQKGLPIAVDADRTRLDQRGELRARHHRFVEDLAVYRDRRGGGRVGHAIARKFDPAANDDGDAFLAVGQDELENPPERISFRGVEARRERIEKDHGRDRADEAAALPIARRRLDRVSAQASGSGEIIIPPRPRFGLIAHLVIG